MLLTRELTKVFRAFFYVNLKDGVFNVKESYKIRFRPPLKQTLSMWRGVSVRNCCNNVIINVSELTQDQS